jgi:hypothetical protein
LSESLAVAAAGLAKSFGARVAVDGIDLGVPVGMRGGGLAVRRRNALAW